MSASDLTDAGLDELLKLVERAHSRCALNITDMTILSAIPSLVEEVRFLRVRDTQADLLAREAEYLRSQLSSATRRAEEAEQRAEDAETQCSSLVSARDLTIRDLRAKLSLVAHLDECSACGHERSRHIDRADVSTGEPCDEDGCACTAFGSCWDELLRLRAALPKPERP